MTIVDILNYFKPLKIELIKFNFNMILIGGIVRDSLIQLEKDDFHLNQDFDFELYYEGTNYEVDYLSLYSYLNDNYQLELCSFKVFKINYNEHSIELAHSRLDLYNLDFLFFGHSDFEVSYIKDKNFKNSFKRRDFTINAIGLTFENELVDPYQGKVAIENKRLSIISDAFFCDPVRMARAIRFKIKFKFNFDKNLNMNFNKFNLSKLTSFYFFSEGFKSGDFMQFVIEFKQIVQKFSIEIPLWLINLMKHLIINNEVVSNKNSLIEQQCRLSAKNTEFLFELASLLGIKKNKVKNLIKLENKMNHND